MHSFNFNLKLGALLVGCFLILALFGSWLAPYGFDQSRSIEGQFGNLVAPNNVNILGTTATGFDVFSRILIGANTALIVMALAVTLAATIGIFTGLVAGFFRGPLDRILSLIAETLFSIPALLIALVISFSLSQGSGSPSTAITAAVIAEGLTFSARYFRVIRAEVQVVMSAKFIEAARVSGISKTRLLFRHVLPNSLKTTPVILTQNSADAMLTLAGLGFLGVGIGPNSGAEWGYDLSQSLSDLASGVWWTALFTVTAVAGTVIGLTLLGEGIAGRLEQRHTIG
jgi:peptide/nickel transport system permease protein